MVRSLRMNAHLLKRQADFAAHVLALVARSKVAVAGFVERLFRRLALVVALEKVEFAFRADVERKTFLARLFDEIRKNLPRIALERLSVCIADVAEETDDATDLRSPRKDAQSRSVRNDEQIRLCDAQKSLDRACVKRNSAAECHLKLARLNRNRLHASVNVRKKKFDEADIIFAYVLNRFLLCVCTSFHFLLQKSEIQNAEKKFYFLKMRNSSSISSPSDSSIFFPMTESESSL